MLGFVKAVLYKGEAVEYIGRHVEGEHRHQHDVHQVDHSLTGCQLFLSCAHSACVLGFLTLFVGIAANLHIYGHRLQHTIVYLIEFFDLLSHTACLLVDEVDIANL